MLNNKDWEKLPVLSDNKRLWYRAGAIMAQEIDSKPGRKRLTP